MSTIIRMMFNSASIAAYMFSGVAVASFTGSGRWLLFAALWILGIVFQQLFLARYLRAHESRVDVVRRIPRQRNPWDE